ncbi:MAG: hypothetical protein H0X25_06360 [Acidobacteriales bacterium]|nr:hypothetical protein [Terriglobales bacterium]
MRRRLHKSRFAERGQSPVELLLVAPLLLTIVLNAVNLGYFFLVAMNVVTAPRSGVQYSMEGFDTTAAILLPSAGPATTTTSVAYLSYQDIAGGLYNSASDASVQVCSKILGLTGSGTSQAARCESYGNATFSSSVSDPEAPWFVLNRVDVSYTFKPLIPGTIFGVVLLPSGVCTASGLNMTCTFHRQAAMRAMD